MSIYSDFDRNRLYYYSYRLSTMIDYNTSDWNVTPRAYFDNIREDHQDKNKGENIRISTATKDSNSTTRDCI